MGIDPASYILFYRDFQGLTGGHLKVWHYCCNVQQSQRFSPSIFFTPASLQDESNPWFGIHPSPLLGWNPNLASILFLAGLDWLAVPETPPCPVVNLIQHIRHGDLADPRYSFLSRRAIRICVSEEVTESIVSTGKVNGPVFTIPNAIDLETFPSPAQVRNIPLLIAGLKNPVLAEELAARFRAAGLIALCQTGFLPRSDFLDLLGRSETVAFLPMSKEGFYLPALEGMAMGALVVCPDCIGNRSFCIDAYNCFRPEYTIDAIEQMVWSSLAMIPIERETMLHEARQEVNRHSLSQEREAFLAILDNLASIW